MDDETRESLISRNIKQFREIYSFLFTGNCTCNHVITYILKVFHKLLKVTNVFKQFLILSPQTDQKRLRLQKEREERQTLKRQNFIFL